MENHLRTVVDLQEALSELDALESQLSGIPDWMSELHSRHSARRTEIEAIEAELEKAGAERRTAEALIEDHQEKLKTYQEQISRVRNQREYGALLQEIDTSKSEIQSCEEQALNALEKQEENQTKLEREKEAFRELDSQYSSALEKWEAEKPTLAAEAEQLKKHIAEVEQRIPQGILATFRRVLAKHEGEALAAVLEVARVGKGPQMWHCSACHYRVRPQAVVEIVNHGNIVLCDSCKRILHVEEAPG
jgi:predicted  nucleic acid-binding Zn-ribbon protein